MAARPLNVLSLCSGGGGSISASSWPSPEPTLWLTSSGKPLRRPLSWRGWRTRPYLRLLSGTTLHPSTAARGVASLIASLRASRVSPGRWRAAAAAPPTGDGFWPDIARIVDEAAPSVVFLENVPGILGHGLGLVLGDLADLGFDAEWGVLGANDVGAPHWRRRLFILAHADLEPWRDATRAGRDEGQDADGEGPDRARVGGGVLADRRARATRTTRAQPAPAVPANDRPDGLGGAPASELWPPRSRRVGAMGTNPRPRAGARARDSTPRSRSG